MRYGKARQFKTNQNILDCAGDVVGGIIAYVMDHTEPDENREEEALPIRGEDDEFYAQELCLACQNSTPRFGKIGELTLGTGLKG